MPDKKNKLANAKAVKQKPKVVKHKDGQLIIRISKEERKAFINLCEELDTTAAREVRGFIREFIGRYEGADTPVSSDD